VPWYAHTDQTTLVPKKPNYDFEKRRKEQLRKEKRDAKLQRKRENAEAERAALGEASPDEPATAE